MGQRPFDRNYKGILLRRRRTRAVIILCLVALVLFTYLGRPRLRPTVAAIVEGRELQNLIPLLTHFSGFLGPDWPIHVFHSERNVKLFSSSAWVAKQVETGGIVLHPLPNRTLDFRTDVDASRFLTSDFMWRRLLPATHVLLFQADSMVCGASQHRPEDFLQYAFVGAPIAQHIVFGGYTRSFNGGISLRHIPSILRVIEEFDWEEGPGPEDQFFSTAIALLTDPPAPRLPTEDEAAPFSVESVWYSRPMAFHQVRRWNPTRLDEVLDYCPEIHLTEAGHQFAG
ncbi:hypothetical protein HDU87_006877 [Geranomyces variabilis]|uniref:DUF5672 domain-containing protein n=1 Tax=Geranomyces variabilis TaxID=109894 RepID=A0AAD5TK97_9FUNG|nr:hypothetical protein HDU87_006877 [Geranomyces variabilis]